MGIPRYSYGVSASKSLSACSGVAVRAQCESRYSLDGITWGKGYDWATVVLDATPLAYAQAGLFPQFQRKEVDVYHTIQLLLHACNRPIPKNWNVPNRYLNT